jgi:hypothetical protein
MLSTPTITDFFTGLGLRNLIFSRHDSAQAPATCSYRNQSGISIDGVWASPTLDLVHGRYLQRGDFPGDHQPIWFEVSHVQAFGKSPPKLIKPQAQCLQLRDPRCVARYQLKLKQLLRKHNLTPRQWQLESHITTSMTPTQLVESNSINAVYKACQELAEQKCRKLWMGGVQFSEATIIPRLQITFWKLILARQRGEHIRSHFWKRHRNATKITGEIHLISTPNVILKLNSASAVYKLAIKSHEESRIKFIETFPLKDQKRILCVEEQRRQARVSRTVTKKLQGGGVKTVLKSIITNGIKTVTECTTKADIEEVLLQVNELKYKQCANSPFRQEPLLSDFGFNGDTASTDAVLAGAYIPPTTTDPYTRLLLHHMVRPPTVPAHPIRPVIITAKEHQQSWKRTKEHTTSGLSGIHSDDRRTGCL